MSSILQCSNLSKSFGSKEALKNINLQLQPGHIVGLLGPNGSGKTTLIKIINGLTNPSCGQVLIQGLPPSKESKKIISYLPDRMYFGDWMKIKDILTFFSDFYADFDNVKALDMLKRLDIDSKAKIKTLSKGTKEKLQLILVMSRKAGLYLLDEPIGGVDPAARDYILQTILNNYNEKSTILLSTHLIQDVEHIFDDIIFLSQGKIVLQGAVDDIREEKGCSIDALFREVFKC